MRFDQPAQHRPVFIPLCLLGPHKVLQGEDVERKPVGQANRGSSPPERGKGPDAPQPGHDVHTHPHKVRMKAPKMNGVSPPQVSKLKRGYGDYLRLEFGQRTTQSRQVRRVGENDQVRIATKLRRAVQDAGLTAHEQGADAMFAD